MLFIYESEYERNTDILFRKLDLDMERIKLEYMIDNFSGAVINEAGEVTFDTTSRKEQKEAKKAGNPEKKQGAISKIVNAVIKFINDLISSVKDIFTPGKEHIDYIIG